MQSTKDFSDGKIRIIAFSGGGTRGIFQARLMERIEYHLNIRVGQNVDCIAGTSTGAIVAASLAAGIRAQDIYSSFRRTAGSVFNEKTLSKFRKGPRYDNMRLKSELEESLGNMRFSELTTLLVIPASVVNNYRGKVFTNRTDPNLLIRDAVLSSTAAPTYFPPWRFEGDERSYYDGGLWANNPSAVAVREVLKQSNEREIHILSVGTGRVSRGSNPSELRKLRTLSVNTIRLMLEMPSALQNWAVTEELKEYFQVKVIEINPNLKEWIPLDDYRKSRANLPSIADIEFEQNREKIEDFFSSLPPIRKNSLSSVAIESAANAGLTRFNSSRRDYSKYRKDSANITDYIEQAQRKLVMVSVNLMTGDGIEGITNSFRKLIVERKEPVKVTVSLLNPDRLELMMAIVGNFERGQNVEQSAKDWSGRISDVIRRLGEFRKSLPESKREYFELKVHNSIPSASAILIDPEEEWGVIQLETKAYGLTAIDAFGFEVGGHTDLYKSLQRAYSMLIEDGERRP